MLQCTFIQINSNKVNILNQQLLLFMVGVFWALASHIKIAAFVLQPFLPYLEIGKTKFQIDK